MDGVDSCIYLATDLADASGKFGKGLGPAGLEPRLPQTQVQVLQARCQAEVDDGQAVGSRQEKRRGLVDGGLAEAAAEAKPAKALGTCVWPQP